MRFAPAIRNPHGYAWGLGCFCRHRNRADREGTRFCAPDHRFVRRAFIVVPGLDDALLRRIRQLVRQYSQFIIATHSPILLAYPNARILLLNQNRYLPVNYEGTERYQLTRRVLKTY